MRRGQTSKRNGYQDFLCPFEYLNITQGAGGNFSHKGTKSFDVAGKGVGTRDAYFAPCDVKVIAAYPSFGEAIWQSVNKVRLANGKIDYVVFVTVHDDTFNAKVGQVYKQGDQIGNMGTKGNATGVHCHFQMSVGLNSTFKPVSSYIFGGVSYPVYGFANEYLPSACWFIDGTTIINSAGYTMKKKTPLVTNANAVLNVATLNKVPSKAIKINKTFKVGTKLNIYEAPNTTVAKNTGLQYKAGMKVKVDYYVDNDGYRWVSWISASNGKRRWMKRGTVKSGKLVKKYGELI